MKTEIAPDPWGWAGKPKPARLARHLVAELRGLEMGDGTLPWEVR